MGSNRSNISKGQRALAQMCAALLGVPIVFEATWAWLLSPKKRYMYVDIYIAKHKLAIEYQGQQHYFYPNMFHKSFEDFQEQQKRDKRKKALLLDHGFRYISWRFNEPLTYAHVAQRLQNAGIPVSQTTLNKIATDTQSKHKRRSRRVKRATIKQRRIKSGANSR